MTNEERMQEIEKLVKTVDDLARAALRLNVISRKLEEHFSESSEVKATRAYGDLATGIMGYLSYIDIIKLETYEAIAKGES